MRSRFGIAPALLMIVLDSMANACAADDEDPTSNGDRDGAVEATLSLGACVAGTTASAPLTLKQWYEHDEYECQLGMCSSESCNEETAYRTITSKATKPVPHRIVSARCEPDCEVLVGEPRDDRSKTERVIEVVRRTPGDVSVSLTVHIETPSDAPANAPMNLEPASDFRAGAAQGDIVYEGQISFERRCWQADDAGLHAPPDVEDAALDGDSDDS